MPFSAYVIIGIYLLSLIFNMIYVLSAKKYQLVSFFMLWGAGIMIASNVPIVIYYYMTGDTYFFYDLSWEQVFFGVKINLVYLLLWQLGFLFGLKIKVSSTPFHFDKNTHALALIYAALTFVAYAYVYSQSYSYGFTNSLYNSGSEQIRSFGTIGIYKNLFLPFITAILAVYYIKKENNLELHSVYQKKYIIKFLWVLLIASIFVGAILDMQRGDIVRSLVFIAIVLVFKGVRIFSIMKWAFAIGILLFALSPIFDILRSPLYDKELSAAVIEDLSENQRAFDNAHVAKEGIFSIQNIIVQIARKNVLPKSAGALAQHAEREGHVMLKTYSTIPYEIIPRAIYKNKPVTLSTNKTKDTMAAAVAGRELGTTSRIWETGGGSFYWQFWWFGTIIGGILMGFIWSVMLKYALYGDSFFLMVMLLGMFNWGQFLILALDNFLVDFFRGMKGIGIFFIFNLVLLFYKSYKK